jgi:Protein kinase domain/Leucine rich repeat/Leucine Rich repeat
MHPVYKILTDGTLKRGLHATVWQAHDHVLDRPVALKELRNWPARPPRARASFRFAHLRRLLLDHPGLAPVHGEDPDRGWLTLDHYPDGSLGDWLLREAIALPIERVGPLLQEVLDTLAYLHSKGFVHGAIQPQNLFLNNRGRIVLADGLGLRLDAAGFAEDARPLFTGLSPEEMRYLAPECVDGKADAIGPSADLYALGLTTLELLLGTSWYVMLFPKVQVAAQGWDEWHLSSEPLPPLRDLLPDVSPALAEVVDGLVRKPAAERLSAAAALAILAPPPPPAVSARPARAARLQPAPPVPASTAPPPAAPVQPRPPAPPFPLLDRLPPMNPRAGIAAVAACAGALVLLAIVGHFLSGKRSPVAEAAPPPAPVVETVPIPTAKDPAIPAPEQDLKQVREQLADAVARAEQAREKVSQFEKENESLRGQLGQGKSQSDGHAQRAALAEKALRAAQSELNKSLQDAQSELKKARTETETQRTRAEGLAAELKRVREAASKAPTAPVVDRTRDDRINRVILTALGGMGAKVVRMPRGAVDVVVKVDFMGTDVRDDALGLLENYSTLEQLVIDSRNLTDAGLAHLKELTGLQSLYLFKTGIGDAGVAHLKGLSNLQTLDLSATRVTDAGVNQLAGLSNLQTLDLSRTRIGDAGLAHVKGMKNIQSLFLSSTRLTDTGLSHVKNLPRLHTLDLSFTKVSDAGLGQLRELANLQSLFLSTTAVSDGGMGSLRGLSRLHTLDLSYTRVTDAGLGNLKEFAGLENLSLSYTRVTDECLSGLRALVRLRALDLSHTRVTDTGLLKLKAFNALETLCLSSTDIGDAGVEVLKTMPSLREVHLDHTRVSPLAVDALQKALPDCVIHR